MMTESPPILQLNNVEAAYGAVKAIRGVSLSVAPGSVVTVLGSNGAGKTTILKTISGILDPQKGSILFRHEKLEGRDPAWIVRQGLVQVPEGREIFPLLTVRENLLMGAYTRPAHEKDQVAKDIEDVYAYFPILKERRDQPAGQLSGGQQQMLAISRALLAKPTMMLLDEPSLGLSPKLTKEIFEIIIRINPRTRRDPAGGRAERAHRAEVRRLRLRAGDRPHRHARYLRRAAREGGHQGVLPRRQGVRRARRAAMEEEEDMEINHVAA